MRFEVSNAHIHAYDRNSISCRTPPHPTAQLENMMIVEYNGFIWRGRWPSKWGLREALEVIGDRKYEPAQDNEDDLYLATHVLYVLSAYSSIKLEESVAPALFKYVRRSLRMWLRRAKNHATEMAALAEEGGRLDAKAAVEMAGTYARLRVGVRVWLFTVGVGFRSPRACQCWYIKILHYADQMTSSHPHFTPD